MALDFYTGQGSPYGWRVWLALELKAIPYNLHVLSFSAGDTRKPEFIAINPRHQVPAIVDDGYAVWESTVVLEYLDEKFSAGPKLFPGDVKSRTRVRRLIREIDQYLDLEGIDPITTEFFGKDGAEPDLAKVEKAKVRLGEELAFLSTQLQGRFLTGDEISAADLVLYPWYGYVKRVTVRKPETKLTDLVPAALKAWGDRIEALPFFDKTFPPHWK